MPCAQAHVTGASQVLSEVSDKAPIFMVSDEVMPRLSPWKCTCPFRQAHARKQNMTDGRTETDHWVACGMFAIKNADPIQLR